MEHLTQYTAAALALAVYYMSTYWQLTLFLFALLGVLGLVGAVLNIRSRNGS